MSIVLTPEERIFIDAIRKRHVTKDPPVTLDEMRKSILILRQRRTAALDASAAGTTKRASTKKAAPTAAQIASALDDFDSF